ncbi:MAG: AAA family ATPase, partial [Bacteroidaceae bacterium]|nr:AAA family ATPase [Bacteroidaceae bacterium]
MIKSLHIENYALIESLDIELRKGFSVITGETGAGKSIILGAIGLLCGQRADTKSIKTGAKRCVVEAEFDVGQYGMGDFFQQNDLDFDGTECIVRRELTSAGKSRAFINDSPVGLSTLKELGERLIDIHSQHQNLLLGKEDFQLNILDTVANNAERLTTYQQDYRALREAEKALAEALEAAKQSKDDEDYLRFQYNQLEEAKLVAGEQAELEEESELLEHAEEIKQELLNAETCIDGGEYQQEGQEPLLQQLKQAMAALRSISDKLKSADEMANRIESCYIEMKDIAEEISQEADSIEFSPERLEQVQERLATLYALEKKHKVGSVEELIDLSNQLSERLMLIDNSEVVIDELQQKVDGARKKAVESAKELSKQRQKAVKEVEKQMVESLVPLG